MQCWEQVAAHFQDKDRDGEQHRDPETPRHIQEFAAWSGVCRHKFRLERHATDRAWPGMVLTDLRVHGAGPDRAWLSDHRLFVTRGQVAHRLGDKLRAASGAAEMILLAMMRGMMRRCGRIDHHPANRILGRLRVRAAAVLGRAAAVRTRIACRNRVSHRLVSLSTKSNLGPDIVSGSSPTKIYFRVADSALPRQPDNRLWMAVAALAA